MLKHGILVPVYMATNGLALLAAFAGESYVWLLLSALITLAIITIGAFDIRLGYFTDTYFKGKVSQNKLIALSFDDGPSGYTPEILMLLEKFDAHATFFCIGKQVLKYPQLSKEIIRKGHTVGNHTFSHLSHFGFMNARQVEQELRDCDRALQDVIGQRPCFFRPPYGVTNPSIATAVKATKHLVIGWSNRSLDTVIMQETKIYKRVVKNLRAGDIVLFHDTSARTVEVLKRLLPTLIERGYTCVTIDKLLNLKAYED